MSATEIIAEAMHESFAYSMKGADAQDILAALDDGGYLVVSKQSLHGLIKSFRDVEQHQLYDSATHRWVDLVAEEVGA